MNATLSQEVSTAGAVALSDAALQLAAASISPRTQELYRRELDRVRADCEPLTDAALAEHLTRRHRDGAAPSTLSLTVAAVRFAAKLRGRPRPDGPAVALVLDGIRRNGRSRGRGQVKGLTWSQADLAAAVAANGGASLAGLRDAALIALQSDALLRVSELCALSVEDVQGQTDGSGRVTVRHSKTDQAGEGAVLYVRRVTMRRIEAWKQDAGITTGPLFRRVYRGGQRTGANALSTAATRSILKRRTGAAGLEAARISGHSARVGAAQSLVRHGATVPELQQVGRWKSSAMPAHYARAELAGRSAVARLREDA